MRTGRQADLRFAQMLDILRETNPDMTEEQLRQLVSSCSIRSPFPVHRIFEIGR